MHGERKDSGFSMVEMIVASVLITIVFTAISAVFISTSNVLRFVENKSEHTAEAGVSTQAIAYVLRTAISPRTSVAAVSIAAEDRVQFYANTSVDTSGTIAPDLVLLDYDNGAECVRITRTPARMAAGVASWPAADATSRCLAVTKQEPRFAYYDRPVVVSASAPPTAPITLPSGGFIDTAHMSQLHSITGVTVTLGVHSGGDHEVDGGPVVSEFLVTLENVLSARKVR